MIGTTGDRGMAFTAWGGSSPRSPRRPPSLAAGLLEEIVDGLVKMAAHRLVVADDSVAVDDEHRRVKANMISA